MKRRTFGIAAIAAAASIAMTACSGATVGSTDNGTDTSLSTVQSAGEIVFATEGTYKPFSFHANGTGDLTGYDVEVARAVAAELGVEAKFEETQWDSIFAGLDAKRFDAIANQVSVNDDRKAKYNLSAPYTVSQGVIVTTEDNTDFKSFTDLKDKTTAQSLTSNWYTLATQSGAKVQAVEGWAQSVALVQQDRVDALVNDKLTFLDHQVSNPDSGLKIAATTEDSSYSAFVLRKDAGALTEAVNKALADLATDGTLKNISDKYFGQDVSK